MASSARWWLLGRLLAVAEEEVESHRPTSLHIRRLTSERSIGRVRSSCTTTEAGSCSRRTCVPPPVLLLVSAGKQS